MSAKISVIMGIYNCASTLGEAIESLLNQTYSDWKLIMCDDGSTDDTYNVAKKYEALYPDKIVLIKNDENKGLNYTLNHCLEYAEGEYIARMDGDDISLPERFEKEIEFLETHKEFAIVSTATIHFNEHERWKNERMLAEPSKRDIVKASPFVHAPCMVRREAYLKVKGYSVEKRLLRVEDYHLWIKMYAAGYKGYNLPDALYMVRDGNEAVRRRAFKYRVNEAYVRYLAIKEFGLPISSYVYMLRPIVVGLLPTALYKYLHKNGMKSNK